MCREFNTSFGKLKVLKYNALNRSRNGFFISVGADIIAYFEPEKGFGNNGDTITFVQIVKDDVCFTKEERKNYMWSKNTSAVFSVGNKYSDTPLDWTIDQVKDNQNIDFRYTESRSSEMDALSSQGTKMVYLWNNRFNYLESDLGKSLSSAKDIKDIEKYLFDDKDPLPEVVFAAHKKDGEWGRARMSDSPSSLLFEGTAVDPKQKYKNEGGQYFQTVVLHEDNSDIKNAICTLHWGWKVGKDGISTKLDELKMTEGCTDEFLDAAKKWDEKMERNKAFKIGKVCNLKSN